MCKEYQLEFVFVIYFHNGSQCGLSVCLITNNHQWLKKKKELKNTLVVS